MRSEPKPIDFKSFFEDYKVVDYKIDTDRFVFNYQSLIEFEFKPKFFTDKDGSYYYKQGYYLFPIDKIVAEEIISDFVWYFENRLTHPQGENKLKECIIKLNDLVKSFDLQ